MVFGDLAIKVSAIAGAVAFVSALRWARGNTAAERTFRWSYHVMTAGLAVGAVLLMAAILGHDFRFNYVIGYSSRDLPLLYLFSAFWAGQQGTYLLWGLIGAAFGYALFRRGAWQPAWSSALYVPTVLFMQILMLNPDGNPFRLAAAVPPDGRGLNPLLQDPWMASHPPMVFVGYVAMTIPAVLALVAVLRRGDDGWLLPALRWSLVSFVTLGTGIVLGGFWAYKVLGWGGYWGWDPVENASLVPWLVVTALLHGLLMQRATGALVRTNIALALAGYVTVFYATFLTRSGLLADFSVHSFPAGSIFKILLGIQLFVLAAAVVGILRALPLRSKDVASGFAWPLVLGTALVLLVISAGMVLIGTSWPIITSQLGRASALNPSWYNKVSLPLYIAVLALLACAPFLAWVVRPARDILRRLVPTLLLAAGGTVLAVAVGARGTGVLMLFFVSLAALIANLFKLYESARGRLLNSGAALAHLGFALMLVGIIASSAWGHKAKGALPSGTPVELLGRSLTFQGHVAGSEPQDRWAIDMTEPDGRVRRLEVGMFRTGSARDSAVMHKPAIMRGASGDFYIAPAGLETIGGEHRELELRKGQPVELGGATLTFERFSTQGMDGEGMLVWAHVIVRRDEGEETLALPFAMRAGQASSQPVTPTLAPSISSLQLSRMSVEQGTILIHADLPGAVATQVLSVEVSTKPLIGLMWSGTLLLGIGCCVAWARRTVDARAMARAAVTAVAAPRAARKRGKRAAASKPVHAARA